MREEEFVKYLKENADVYECSYGTYQGSEGLFVSNKRFTTCTHFTKDAMTDNPLNFLISQTVQGKDVDHITRITGYFTRVSSWNKGKRGELQDRYRSGLN